MLKPSAAVETIIPGIWLCQWSSFKSFCPWWTKSSWGGKSWGVLTCSLVCALNSASSSSSFSKDKSHILQIQQIAKKTLDSVIDFFGDYQCFLYKLCGLRELVISGRDCKCRGFMSTPLNRRDRMLMILKMCYLIFIPILVQDSNFITSESC